MMKIIMIIIDDQRTGRQQLDVTGLAAEPPLGAP